MLGKAFRTTHPDVELLTEEMWNSRMPAALRSGLVDLAISLCPEISGELSYEIIRSEGVLALLTHGHRLAGEAEIALDSLAAEQFVLFPRELAPRLYDSLVGLCRRAGFEPRIRSESFHTSWEVGVLADVPVVALVPESVARQLPPALVSVRISEPVEQLDTALLWHSEAMAAPAAAFREIARTAFARPLAHG